MTSTEARERTVLAALAERRELINDALAAELPIGHPAHLYEASRHLLDAGGKRLRPALLLLVAELLADVEPMSESYRSFPTLDGDRIDVMAAAVSIEVIQSFTLIHDDIMDDDDLRRGVPAVHREYDLETAILAGDTLYSKAFEIMLATGAQADRSIEALRVLAETCTRICEGQALDIEFETREHVSVEEYLEMVEYKTAVLFRAAASVPAILLGADRQTVDALAAFGLSVGKAFQIQDDVLDLTVPSEALGKQRGSDLIEGKRTIITLHANEQGVDVDALLESDDPAEVSESAVEAAVAELDAAGSIAFATERAQRLVREGTDQLSTLPDNEARHLIEQLSTYMIERGY